MRLILPVMLAAVLMAGCASSERMNRMSGGVVREYSAPKENRIRSAKFAVKSEKLYFPFVSIREDGPDRRFSFLGRVYQKTVRNGRTGGYILFIPFGERIQ